MNAQTFSRDPHKRKTPSACVVSEAVVIAILTLAISLSLRLPACAFVVVVEMKISSRTLFPLFMPGSVHSGSAS